MKFTTKFLMVVVFWAALVALGVLNFWRAYEREREFVETTYADPFQYMFDTRPRLPYRRQQLRLCEWAIAAKPEAVLMQDAEANFLALQQRYGRLQIDDPQTAAIVTIPEACVPERLEYAWRIHLPADRQYELAGYVKDHDEPASGAAAEFTQPLAAGESVIRIVCQRGRVVEWGSVASPDLSTWGGRLTLSIDEGDFHWQTIYSTLTSHPYANRSLSQQTLFASEDNFEIMRMSDFVTSDGKKRGDLYLVVRQIKPAPTE